MTEQTKTRIPAPIYAAAGAGDLAYEQLRKLPAVVTELRDKATAGTADLRHRAVATRDDLRHRAVVTRDELRDRASATLKDAGKTAADLREKATSSDFDLEHLREAARRNAQAVLDGAQHAQARAVEVYHQLVARGEKVVGGGIVEAAETVNADIEATEAAELTATPADVVAATEVEPAKVAAKAPAKRTRPATRK